MSQHDELEAWQPSKAFAVGIDSDGCVMDVMNAKHQTCFGPAWVDVFGLEAVRDAALEVWQYVNLFSPTRGVNRFKGVALALEHLQTHPVVCSKGFTAPRHPAIAAWVAEEKQLGMPALKARVQISGDVSLSLLMAWSEEVNRRVAVMATQESTGGGVFPGAAEAVQRSSERAEVLVISQAPRATLLAEWSHQGLAERVSLFAGQEIGSKAEQLKRTACRALPRERVLMLGDAPGDREAAEANGVRFFPIIPGCEEACWRAYTAEMLPRFIEGSLTDSTLHPWLDRFAEALPQHPVWKVTE